jgi:hypothetical protein
MFNWNWTIKLKKKTTRIQQSNSKIITITTKIQHKIEQ